MGSKFKSSRPNPFENLLRLQKQDSQSSTSACSSSSQKKPEPIFVNKRGEEEEGQGTRSLRSVMMPMEEVSRSRSIPSMRKTWRWKTERNKQERTQSHAIQAET